MEKRQKEFQKNLELEKYLEEINGDLLIAEQRLLKSTFPKYPVILVMGALRSGTTLATQWLANTGEFVCPSNLVSRFYQAPVIGAKIQRLLLDPIYNFRNELTDRFSTDIGYSSQNGKTHGVMAPNEFWFFWRRFFPYANLDIDYMPDEELAKVFDKETFVKELMGIADVFQKPLAMKGMIANYNIGFLDSILESVIFIHTKREPCSNIASALEAKKRQLGNDREWYSFRIPQMQELLHLNDPVRQAAGQIYYINAAIEKSLENVSEERKMDMQYEEFCENPKKYYDILRKKLNEQGFLISENYRGKDRFEITRKVCSPEIKEGYLRFLNETIN